MTDSTPAPQDRLTVEVTEDDPVVLRLRGDLDPHTSPYLQELVDERVEGGANAVVLDMAEVSFVDSAGLRVLADSHRRLTAAGGSLVVRNPTSGLQKLLAVTGLADHIAVEA